METTAEPLLRDDDPPPFHLVNPEGRAPVLLTCDHASRVMPGRLQALGLDEAALARHIAWDIGAAEVTRELAKMLDAPAVLAGYSRLVIDLNRVPDGEGSIPPVSDGVVIPGNEYLCDKERATRRRELFDPYHQALSAKLDAMTSDAGAPVVLAMHSFTPVMESFERPWQIGILWGWDPRLPEPLIARLRALGLTVGDNEPYSGRGLHGYSQQTHIDGRGLAGALVEIRQDLIDTHRGVEQWAALLRDVLTELLQDPRLYRVEETARSAQEGTRDG